MPPAPIDVINSQIAEAADHLQQYRPLEMRWHERSVATAAFLVPWLQQNAVELSQFVEGVLNAPLQLRRMWTIIKPHVELSKEQIDAFDRQLSLDDVLRESMPGELVSKIVTKFLLDKNDSFAPNSPSNYPDIYIKTLDYNSLPIGRRARRGETVEYGAALKQGRPARVPDGLEVKTCRDRIAVDCHYNHAGLHLCLVFAKINRVFVVSDLRIAFLQPGDYRPRGRNTEATTVKYSFNGDRFLSLLPTP